MINAGILSVEISESSPSATSQNLSRYREFQFGASPHHVVEQIHVQPSELRMIHQRPAVIQELKWQAPLSSISPGAESVNEIIFSFYNNELFRMVVTYNLDRIEGMTAEDIIEAVSARYGAASKPDADIVLFSSYLHSDGEKSFSERTEKIIARWEDQQYSFNLIRPSYPATFELVMFSKRLDALAREASLEAIRLDMKGAPQRETQLQMKKDEETRARQERARRVNKPPFRP